MRCEWITEGGREQVISSVRRGFHVTERGYGSTCSKAAAAVNLGGNTVHSSQASEAVFIFYLKGTGA